MRLRASPVLDVNGQVAGFVEVAEDIQIQKRSEEARQESEQRFRSVVETSPDAIALLDLDGRILIVVFRDITKRKHAEDELRKFRTISDNANYGTAIADMEGNFVYVNDAFARMHGWEAADLLGRHFSVVHNEEQMARVGELLARLSQEDGFSTEEVLALRGAMGPSSRP